jgi:hypothetical protein
MIKIVLCVFMSLLAPASGNGAQDMTARGQGLTAPQEKASPEAEDREWQKMSALARYGYIDRTGTIVIPPRFEEAEKFSEGRARVKIDGRYGFIDNQGEVVIRPQFFLGGAGKLGRSAESFSEGLAAVKISEKGLFGFIDRSGSLVVPPKFTGVRNFSQGLAQATMAGTGEKIGFINKKGDWVIPPQFLDATDFSEDLAAVQLGEDKGNKWGYIDRNGIMVIPPRFEEAFQFTEGLAKVDLGDHLGFIDKQGKVVIKTRPGFYRFEPFSQGRAVFSGSGHRAEAKQGFMDKTGEVVIPAQFAVAAPFAEGLAAVDGEKGVGYIDLSGKMVIPPQFPCALSFSEGLAPVQVVFQVIRRKWGYIDKTGKIVIEPKFLAASPFSEGLAAVEIIPEKAGPGKVSTR